MNMRVIGICLAVLLVLTARNAHALEPSVDFSRDVRPILADKCFPCHGPDADARQADLRLDAYSELQSDRGGYSIVVPNEPGQSALIDRIASGDKGFQMPPSDSNLKLSEREQQILRQWIAEGAKWEGHWSFQPIGDSQVPEVNDARWRGNEIDHFTLRQMRRRGLQPSPPADRETLIRRLSLDLTGLPPTPAETASFLADGRPDGYERLVDRLLADPNYGEQMSLSWLDAARYADTDGYQNDGPRSMWRWRDWVIDALNRDMPFDQFTIEQLAGDWISNATLDQQIATGFNRNHRYNSESGLVQEEFLLENAVDRVDTVSTVWMGLTMGCARCHDHKFDPFSQREYYQLVAFFDDVSESGRAVKFGNSEPWVVAPTAEQQQRLTVLDRRTAQAERSLVSADSKISAALSAFESQHTAQEDMPPVVGRDLTHHLMKDGDTADLDGRTTTVLAQKGPPVRCQSRSSVATWIRPRDPNGVAISIQPNSKQNTYMPGLSVELRDGRLRYYIITRWVAGVGAVETTQKLPMNKWSHVVLANDGSQSARGMQVFVNGKPAQTRILYNTNSNVSGDAQHPVRIGGSFHAASFDGQLRDLRFYNRTLRRTEIESLAVDASPQQILAMPAQQRTLKEQAKLRAWFLEHRAPPELALLAANRFDAHAARQKFYDSLPTTMVMDHDSPQPTYVRRRGVYSNHGEQVNAATPAVLPPSAAGNRLEFAKWLVNDDHPLTARVTVNRYWQQFFGRGLVDTPEDFGVQGSPPSHPELLDWLAAEFQRSGWDVKRLHRLIVTSATYRQSSRANQNSLQTDPVNRWLSRAPRRRLPAHAIRDQALKASGLLVSQIGGPSVSPYQPPDLWKSLSNMQYKQSTGAGLYRRSLYTIWKRTLVPPTMSILDAADRENCSVRPKRTNTPLQALTLLNETAFVEAARGMAKRMLAHPSDSVAYGFQLVAGRQPNSREQELLRSALDDYRIEYRDKEQAAKKLLSVGESPISDDVDLVELAAHTVLANLLLNLDEAITRE